MVANKALYKNQKLLKNKAITKNTKLKIYDTHKVINNLWN